jgi:hypothetical protein
MDIVTQIQEKVNCLHSSFDEALIVAVHGAPQTPGFPQVEEYQEKVCRVIEVHLLCINVPFTCCTPLFISSLLLRSP